MLETHAVVKLPLEVLLFSSEEAAKVDNFFFSRGQKQTAAR